MPEAGDLIGPYRLVSQLGKGAMGEVWRARDERLDRYVALKVLPAELAGDLERRTRMLREARAAAAIRHANVVTLFDIVKHQGDDILVMELVEGRTLSDALRKDGKPALEVALRWIEGVVDALCAAHARGILHRDIKAANIMVIGDAVKVLDFGLAKLKDDVALQPTAPRALPAITDAKATVPTRPIALDETMPSESGPLRPSGFELTASPETYQTHAGQLLGTPLYMAPEQIAGAQPDERSEVFSVGVLAYEILAGKPPYSALSIDALFMQIAKDTPAPLEDVPPKLAAIVARALAKDPAERWPSMQALRDALGAERRPVVRRTWPFIAALVIAAAAFAVYWWRSHRAIPERPGDTYVARALEEYDVFYNEKAFSSLRAAIAVAPEHPRANAYMVLFGAPDASLAACQRALATTDAETKDRALVDTAIALVQRGPAAARAALTAANAETDRELAFWSAELDYRAGNYIAARDEYKALLDSPTQQLRGRIYDHDSSVLLYLDEPAEALRIGTLYRDAFPGEADAVGVYATTLAAAGKMKEAVAAAEDALRLNEGEDTLAGLAKVLALAGDRTRAKELYQRSLDRAGPSRRPLRRAALGLLQWIDGDPAAKATVAPCLSDPARERGACLFVAGAIDPEHAETIAMQLDALAAEASAARPAYGAPRALATLVRARSQFFGGACMVAGTGGHGRASDYAVPVDFYAAYHVPFFATWAVCEHAALLAHDGDIAGAHALLGPVATRAPNRAWLLAADRTYVTP